MSSPAHNIQITRGTLSSLSAFERLEKATAHAAFHDAKERSYPPRCHPRTRVAIQAQIKQWICREEDPDVGIMWLTGDAGTGKSAIAQDIAEHCAEEGRLAAAFFFGRLDPARNDGGKLIATIAYQMCLHILGFQEFVESSINRDPLVFTRSLTSQMKALIIDPLLQLRMNPNFDPTHIYAVIIDGLDECHGRDTQCSILTTIADAISEASLSLCFLVASCPESNITSTFMSRKLEKLHIRRTLDHSLSPDQDIKTFLRDSFDDIKETHILRSYIPSHWPSDEDIGFLVHKASGQFIYASVVIKYVKSPRRRPTDCLDNILGLRPISDDMPFAELDSLYRHMLEDVEDIVITMKILTFLILNKQRGFLIEGRIIEHFLCLSPGDIRLHLDNLISIIDIWRIGDTVSISHASFADFLLDKRRSAHFFIDTPVNHETLARMCFHHLRNKEPIHHVDSDPSTEYARDILWYSHHVNLNSGTARTRREVLRYSQLCIERFCAKSIPTPELCIDISEFSIFDAYAITTWYCWPVDWFEPLSMWRFINSIGILKLEGGKAIMNRHLQNMRTLIIQILGMCFSTHVNFAFNISIYNLVRPHRIDRSIRGVVMNLAIEIRSIGDFNPRLRPTSQTISFETIFSPMVCRLNEYPYDSAYVSLLRECIKEREEKAMHPLDRGKYAITAVGVFQVLSSERYLKHNSKVLLRYSCHYLNIRRTQPCKWRRMRFVIHGTLVSTRLYRWRIIYCRDKDIGEMWTSWKTYRTTIGIIPDLLDRCDYNAKLIDLAKTISFPYHILRFRREQAALVAIRKYLRRHLPINEHSIL